MGIVESVSFRSRRALTAIHKLRWGIRTVGVVPALSGGTNLLALRLRKPQSAQVLLDSGQRLEFDYPSQLVPALVVFGGLIDPEFAFIRAVSKASWTFVDVGAAIGQFTVFATSLPGRSMVHAFEPSAQNVTTLQRNLELNGVADQVQVHKIALSDHEGEASFSTAATTYLSRLDRTQSGSDEESVRVATLDGVLSGVGVDHVHVLKLNVAGFEPAVLDGSTRLLARGGASILVILISRESYAWYARLNGWGYRFFFFHPGQRRLHEVTQFDDAALAHPPWPARHVIAIHEAAIQKGLLGETVSVA